VGLAKYGRVWWFNKKKRLGGCGAGKENPQEGGVPWWLKTEGSGVWHGKNSPTWAVKWQVYDKIQDR
jgi:hypothetical protein